MTLCGHKDRPVVWGQSAVKHSGRIIHRSEPKTTQASHNVHKIPKHTRITTIDEHTRTHTHTHTHTHAHTYTHIHNKTLSSPRTNHTQHPTHTKDMIQTNKQTFTYKVESRLNHMLRERLPLVQQVRDIGRVTIAREPRRDRHLRVLERHETLNERHQHTPKYIQRTALSVLLPQPSSSAPSQSHLLVVRPKRYSNQEKDPM